MKPFVEHLLRRGNAARRFASATASAYTSVALTAFDKAPTVISIRPGQRPLNDRKAAVFSHFDANGGVSAAARHYVAALAEAVGPVIFVSSSPCFGQSAYDALAPHCASIVRRRNIGHDFGAWRDGLSLIEGLASFEQIVLANDSMLGPFAALGGYIEQCDDSADVWGFTDSYQRNWHLQSYFLLFRSRALSSAAFRDYWRTLRLAKSRQWAIKAGELAISKQLHAAGLRLRALYALNDLTGRSGQYTLMQSRAFGALNQHSRLGEAMKGANINPAHGLWKHLIEARQFPFLKRDLVRGDRMLFDDIADWRSVVQTAFPNALPEALAAPDTL